MTETREWTHRLLQFLGTTLDETKNTKNERTSSAIVSKASVNVIKTNEELIIA